MVGIAAACAWSCSQHSGLGENVQSFQQALSSTGGQAGTQVDQVDLKSRLPNSVPLEQVGPGEVVDGPGSCTRCPVGLVTTDGLTCTVCPLGASPNAAQSSCVSCPADFAITLAPSCNNVVVQVPASHPGDACPDQAWIDVDGVAATLGWGLVVSPVPGSSAAVCPQTSTSALAFVPNSSQVLVNATASGVPCIPSGAIDLCQAICGYDAGLGSMPPTVSGRIG